MNCRDCSSYPLGDCACVDKKKIRYIEDGVEKVTNKAFKNIDHFCEWCEDNNIDWKKFEIIIMAD